MSDDITKVEPMEPSKKNSAVADSLREESTVILDHDNPQCHWNDVEFADGSKVCDNGVAYECHMGRWVKLDQPC